MNKAMRAFISAMVFPAEKKPVPTHNSAFSQEARLEKFDCFFMQNAMNVKVLR